MSINGQQVPLLGQQEMAQRAAAQQLYLGMYIPLLPHLAIHRLTHGYGIGGEEPTPEQIAEEAQQIVNAAMARLGFQKA